MLIALAWIYVAFGQVDWVAGLFHGIKPAVAAIVLHAVWRIGSRTLQHPARVPLLWAIALASFVALAWLKVPFPWVVAAAALAGVAGGRLAPGQFALAGSHGASAVRATGAATGWVIDDHT